MCFRSNIFNYSVYTPFGSMIATIYGGHLMLFTWTLTRFIIYGIYDYKVNTDE
jgi:hypothetical protein